MQLLSQQSSLLQSVALAAQLFFFLLSSVVRCPQSWCIFFKFVNCGTSGPNVHHGFASRVWSTSGFCATDAFHFQNWARSRVIVGHIFSSGGFCDLLCKRRIWISCPSPGSQGASLFVVQRQPLCWFDGQFVDATSRANCQLLFSVGCHLLSVGRYGIDVMFSVLSLWCVFTLDHTSDVVVASKNLRSQRRVDVEICAHFSK